MIINLGSKYRKHKEESQATATRPLAIQKDGTWFTYGYDITKNICEVFGQHGYIRTAYSYAPFGNVTESGDVSHPFQWSSEYYDSELDLVYYNYRHYSPSLGRFLSRDPIAEQGGLNLYAFVRNNPILLTDSKGEAAPAVAAGCYAGIGIYAFYAAAGILGISLCECLLNEMCRKTAARITCESACEAAYRIRCAICDATYPFDETGNKFCKKEASTAYALCLADC